jgi:transposase-like protein
MTAKSDLEAPQFTNEKAAIANLEASRWPDGVNCPHCGSVTVTRMGGETQAGMFQCNDCRDKFTARTGTVMERSHIPVRKWLLAIHLLNSSKKGMSAHQMHRMLGITYKSAWFLCHRIREAMRPDDAPGSDPLGGKGKVVEADETYFGNVPEAKRPTKTTKGRKFTKGGRSGPSGKRAVVALVERGGRVRSFHPATADGNTVSAIVLDNIRRESRLHTDESRLYIFPGSEFKAHETVTHSHKEYVRGDIHTNTIEGVFSIFKRGMKGIYQHCSEKHLHRYLAEFDFRYNQRTALGYSDGERAAIALKGIEGKRLTYRIPR